MSEDLPIQGKCHKGFTLDASCGGVESMSINGFLEIVHHADLQNHTRVDRMQPSTIFQYVLARKKEIPMTRRVDLTLAVDFDGTIVSDKYPDIGEPVPGAFRCLKLLLQIGVKLILWSPRSGNSLDQALAFCHKNGIWFFAAETNPNSPSKLPRPTVDAYISRHAINCPMTSGDTLIIDAHVDWITVGENAIKHMLAN